MRNFVRILFCQLCLFCLILSIPARAQTTVDDGDDMDVSIDCEIVMPTTTYLEVTPLSFGSFYVSKAGGDIEVDHFGGIDFSLANSAGDGNDAHSNGFSELSGVDDMFLTMIFANNTVLDHETEPVSIPLTGITARYGGNPYTSGDSVLMVPGASLSVAGVLEIPVNVIYGLYSGVLSVQITYD